MQLRRCAGTTRLAAVGLASLAPASLALALCVVLAHPAPSAAADNPSSGYALTVWTADAGLPPGEILVSTQDLEGTLWLGTTMGIVRFDGSRFAPWGSRGEAPLPGRGVQALVGARDGSVWLGFNDTGGVVRIRDGRPLTFENDPAAPTGNVVTLLADRQGAIWAGARDGLFRYGEGRWTKAAAGDGYKGGTVYSLYEDSAGRLWVGAADGVYRRDDSTFVLVDAASNNAQSLAEDDAGDLWVTDTYRVVRRLSPGSRPAPTPGIRLPASGWRLLRDRRGQIWVAALGGGLLRVSAPHQPDASVERFAYEHRVAGSPRSLFEDRDGNIWVGMRGGGLLRLSESSIVTDVPLAGLTNDGVRAAAVTPDGSVWLATGHSLNRFQGERSSMYDLSQTMVLHTDHAGTLWAATALGLGRIVDGRFVTVSTSPKVRWGRVLAVATETSGRIWLCTSQQGPLALDGDALSSFEGATDVAGRPCGAAYVDRQGRVWIGFTGGGVAMYEGGVFTRFGAAQGLAGGRVAAIMQDRAGAVWISTSEGVSRFQNGQFVSITAAHGPFADLVPALVEDDEGYLWVGVNAGAAVLRFHPREVDKVAANRTYNIEYALYDGSDGMQGELQWISGLVGVRAGDGRLWFATGLGAAVIDPRNLPRTRRPPPPRVTLVTADGERLVAQPGITLRANTSQLRIEYGTVSLSSASKLRFRYMLDPADGAGWVHAGTAREVTYVHPPSGSLRFRVSATSDGLWTEAGVLEFSIAPPFYRTTWFISFVALSVVLSVALAWWLRLRTLRSQYALVFAERARVSREIHDTLLQSLGAIGVELETIASQLDQSQETARDALRRLRRQVGHSLREARESIWELRHRALETRGLVESLQQLAENTTDSKGVHTEVTVRGRERRCTSEVDMQLFRIAQEAVNNAIRHGRATRIDIALSYEPERVSLTVADDGCGFVAEQHEAAHEEGEHLGLLSMRERATRIRGRLGIDSGPGRGTTIEVSSPLTVE
jgi:signal transduction histidine kinase/ligand-binding sensor domain-containing protein